ncbi:MAG TPA: hypothetical protein VFH59_07865 [Frateuria sp.]|uniref:hypothetical protein n=1 Tax=Frateuria sp. TaxID=2211372 RepID=UPI002D7E3DF5|nr:hypothetical protein [Frateuria sp.]HET6805338.1 hypothetical protein [Frateuria sp.]
MTYVPGPGWLKASASAYVAALATWSQPFDFVGVPAPVVFMAFAGAAAGLILQPPNVTRLRMFAWALAFTLFGAVCTVVLGVLPHMGWTQGAAPAIAGLLSLFAKALVPAVRDRIGREVKDRAAPTPSGDAP